MRRFLAPTAGCAAPCLLAGALALLLLVAGRPAAAQAPSAQAPLAQAPLAQAPLAQAPLAQAPLAQAPLAQAPLARAPLARASRAAMHFTGCPSRTGQSASVIVPPAAVRLGKAALAAGDEIALFTEKGRCAGRAVWRKGGALALTAWGDDAMTKAPDGFASGSAMHVRLWDVSRQVEHHAGNSDIQVHLDTRNPYAQTRLRYVPNGLYVIKQLRVKTRTPAAADL